MMREMMGMPADSEDGQSTTPTPANTKLTSKSLGDEADESNDDEEDQAEEEDIRHLAQAMETELKEAGALHLDSPVSGARDRQKEHGSVEDRITTADDDRFEEQNESNEELNIDFNLAKNLLESFKSQAGMAGPSGNLIGMMGMRLPRDEEDAHPGPASTNDNRKE